MGGYTGAATGSGDGEDSHMASHSSEVNHNIRPGPELNADDTSLGLASAGGPSSDFPGIPSGTALSGLLRALALVVLGAVAGAATALLVLFGINGSLLYARWHDLSSLRSEVATLQIEARSLAGSTENVTTRLGGVEVQLASVSRQAEFLDGEVANLAAGLAEAQGLREQTARLMTEVEMLSAEMEALSQSVTDVQHSATRFDDFLSGLRSALEAAQGE